VSGKIHIVGVGSTVITASQSGDVNYFAASNATQTLYVVANTGLFNETFNYTDGSLTTNGGYTEAGTYVGGTGRTVGGTSLTYTDGGGSYILSGAGKTMTTNIGTSATDYYNYKAFTGTAVTSGILYLSFLMKANANISSSNQEVMGLSNGTSAGPKVLIGKTTSGNFKIGTVRGSTSSIDYKYATTPTSLTVGSTYFIVLKYEISSATSSVYINPTLGGTEPASPEISDNTSGTTRTQFNNLWFRSNGSTLVQNYDLSSARISTSWADAVAKYTAIATYAIVASSSNVSMGTVTGSASYPTGASVSVVATPLSGYRFVNWTESGTEVSTSATYTFAASVVRTLVANFAISTSDQTISFSALPNKTVGDADFAPGATATSGLAVSYASSNTAVATIVNGNIHIVGAGTSTITASQAGDASHNAATNATQLLTVAANPVLLDETFNYTDGAISGQGSWTEAGTHDGAGRTIGSPALYYNDGVSLSYINSGVGKAMTNVITSVSSDYKAYKPFNATAINSAVLYLSLLLKVNDNVSSTNQEAFGLADGTSAGPKVLIGKTTSGFYKIGTVRASSASVDYKYAASPTSLTVGATNFIVLKYDFATSTSSVYVNPTLGGTEPASPEISDNTSTVRTQLINLWSRSTGSTVQNYNLGGVRVSTTWAAAVASTAYTPPVSLALPAPTVGSASAIGSGGFTANWTTVSNALSYTVKVYWGTSFVDSTNVSGQSASSVTVTNLIPGLTYTYKLIARGDGINYTNSALSLASTSFTLSAATIPANNLKIILKLDDLGVLNSVFAASPAWDYMKDNNIKWGSGAIASRFDATSNGVLSTYLNATNSVGDTLVEVWNHGYDHSYNSGTGIYEFTGTYADQKTHFDNATQAVKTYLDLQMHSFGTPYNASDANTNIVIGEDPNYKVMMFSDVKSTTNGVTYLDNRVNMESATGNPEFSYFIDNYNAAKTGTTDYMILQGHPNYYTAGSSNLDQLKLIIQYLLSQGCEFVRPYDYYRSLSLTAPTNLKTSIASATQINLTWTDNASREVNYKIERSTDNTNWTIVGTAAANSSAYSDNNVTNGTYYYRIYANCGIKSVYSNSAIAVSSSIDASTLSTCTDCDLTISSGNTLTVSASKTVKSITVESGASIDLTNTLAVTDLTLKADSTHSFSAKIASTVTVNGAFNYVRLMDDTRWYFMAFPCSINVADIKKADGSTLSIGSQLKIYSYNGTTRAAGSTSNWTAIASNETLTAKKGYIFGLATGQGSYEVKFPLSTSILAAETDATIPLTYYGSGTSAAENNKGWNLVGQPYLSKFAYSGTNAVVNYMIFPDGAAAKTYSVITNTSGTLIDPFAAYFVQAGASMETSGIAFSIAGRQSVPAAVSSETSEYVQLNVRSTTGIDHTNLIMDNAQNTAYEIGMDLEKWIGTETSKPQIYTILGGVNYAYNALPMASVSSLPVGIYTKSAVATTISVEPSNSTGISRILLKDNSNGSVTDLISSNYNFTSTEGTDNNRFEITIERLSTKSFVTSEVGKPIIIVKNGYLTMYNLTEQTEIKIFDAIGHLLANKTASAGSLEIPLNKTGVYFIKIEMGNKSWTEKIVL
jgi:hypothetical protein